MSPVHPLTFGNGYIISSHTLLVTLFLVHAGIELIHVSKISPIIARTTFILISSQYARDINKIYIVSKFLNSRYPNADCLLWNRYCK